MTLIWTPKAPRAIQPFPNKQCLGIYRFRHGSGPKGTVYDESGWGRHATANDAASSSYYARRGVTGAREGTGSIEVVGSQNGVNGWKIDDDMQPDWSGRPGYAIVMRIWVDSVNENNHDNMRFFSRAADTGEQDHDLMIGLAHQSGTMRTRVNWGGTTETNITSGAFGDAGWPGRDEWCQVAASGENPGQNTNKIYTKRDDDRLPVEQLDGSPSGEVLISSQTGTETWIGTNAGSTNKLNNFRGGMQYLYLFGDHLYPDEIAYIDKWERERRYEKRFAIFNGYAPSTGGPQEATAPVAAATAAALAPTAEPSGFAPATAPVASATASALVPTAELISGVQEATAAVAGATASAPVPVGAADGAVDASAGVASASASALVPTAAGSGTQEATAAVAGATAASQAPAGAPDGSADATAPVAAASTSALVPTAEALSGEQEATAPVAAASSSAPAPVGEGTGVADVDAPVAVAMAYAPAATGGYTIIYIPAEDDTERLEIIKSGLREVDVASFGAVADSITDASAAIQEAIDLVASAGGGAVLIPSGEYRVRETINLASNLVLRGVGPGAVTLLFEDLVAGRAAILAYRRRHVKVEHLRVVFDGADPTSTFGIRTMETDWASLLDCFVKGFAYNIYNGGKTSGAAESDYESARFFRAKDCGSSEAHTQGIRNFQAYAPNVEGCVSKSLAGAGTHISFTACLDEATFGNIEDVEPEQDV